MRVLIIEDEQPAAEKLSMFLKKYDAAIEVLGIRQSITESVDFLQQEDLELELIFMDIQLADGNSFEIFSQINPQQPIIFTTAYQEHALEAFQVNGIAYLLKPYTYADFTAAMEKLDHLKSQLGSAPQVNAEVLTQLSQLSTQNYQQRFMVKWGEHLKSIPVEEIAVFYAEGKNAFLLNKEGRRYNVDQTLETLSMILDPQYFFRVSRSIIVRIDAITDILVYSNSRLKVNVGIDLEKEIIVSRDKVPAFKEWLNR